jgi:hypothetical protein
VNFGAYFDEQDLLRLDGITPFDVLRCSVWGIPKDFNELADKVQTNPEGDDYLNGINGKEKQIFGDREILENLVCLLQKTRAHG